MDTLLIKILRESIASLRSGRVLVLVVSTVLPILIGVGVLAVDGRGLFQAILLYAGGVAVALAWLFAALSLGRADARLQKRRGLTIGQILGSSGFALLRQEAAENRASSISVTGTQDDVLMKAERSLQVGEAREFRAYLDEVRNRDLTRSPWSRVKAVLHSSGFSVIREGLPDKDQDRIWLRR
jgi:hypothetical protein